MDKKDSKQSLMSRYGPNKADRALYARAAKVATTAANRSPLTGMFKSIETRRKKRAAG